MGNIILMRGNECCFTQQHHVWPGGSELMKPRFKICLRFGGNTETFKSRLLNPILQLTYIMAEILTGHVTVHEDSFLLLLYKLSLSVTPEAETIQRGMIHQRPVQSNRTGQANMLRIQNFWQRQQSLLQVKENQTLCALKFFIPNMIFQDH